MKQKPIIYQLLPRLYGNLNAHCIPDGTLNDNGCGRFEDITTSRIQTIKELGANHIWLTGAVKHASVSCGDDPKVVKGKAGSPYAISDYYETDPDLGTLDDLEALIKRIHEQEMKVVMDFVPNHTARRYHTQIGDPLGEQDEVTQFFLPTNDYYYLPGKKLEFPQGYDEYPAKASGNDCFSEWPTTFDWYETAKLNYGIDPRSGAKHFNPRPPLWYKMVKVLLYWAGKGADAFRCDMVHMVPVEFWQWAIARVKGQYPHVKFIGELYDPAIYHSYIFTGGFDYLYDKVGLADTLRGVEKGFLPAKALTGAWQTVDGIQARMMSFIENHDEQRFASGQYAGDGANILPSLVVTAAISTGPVLVYSGQELGEHGADAEGFSGNDGKTTIFDYWSIPAIRRFLLGNSTKKELSILDNHRKVLNLCREHPAIVHGGFFDLMYVNPQLSDRQYAFLRAASENVLLIVVNFDNEKHDIEVNIPQHAFDILKLPVKEQCVMTDLLTGRHVKASFTPSKPVKIKIKGKGATLLQL